MNKLLDVMDSIDTEYLRIMQEAIKELKENKDTYVACIFYVGGGTYDLYGESYWTYDTFDKSKITDNRIRLGKSLYDVDITENYSLYELMMLAGEEKQRIIRELENTLKEMK